MQKTNKKFPRCDAKMPVSAMICPRCELNFKKFDTATNAAGKKALNEIIKYVKTMPLGKGEKLYLSYVPGNDYAEKLYKDAGFVPNGEKDGEEIVLVLDLEQKEVK